MTDTHLPELDELNEFNEIFNEVCGYKLCDAAREIGVPNIHTLAMLNRMSGTSSYKELISLYGGHRLCDVPETGLLPERGTTECKHEIVEMIFTSFCKKCDKTFQKGETHE
jgi:hypothetical protein